MASEIDDQILQDLYSWIDEVPLSRQKRNISRDFSDGVLMAELVKYYFPNLVDLHNFPSASSANQKKKNWHLLNWKVFKKLNFELSNEVIDSLVNCKPGTVERVLLLIRTKIDRTLYERKRYENDNPTLPKLNMSETGNWSQPLASNRPAKFTERTLGNGVRELISPGSQNRGRYNNGIPPARAGFQQASLVSQADLVPRVAYEERVQECLNKEEVLNVLQSKIRKMEHLLHLKDIRIDELSRRLESMRPTAANGASGGGGAAAGSGAGANQATRTQPSRATNAPPAMAPGAQFPMQPPALTQAQLQQLQMQFGQQPQMQFRQPPQMQFGQQQQFPMPPMGAMPAGAQYNPNYPPFMPLPPIPQPQNQQDGNNEQEMMVSAE